MSELAPGFLVAVPQMGDPNFQRGVVLLMEHGPQGAIGIMVNRVAGINLGEVAKSQKIPRRLEMDSTSVFVGGPVQPERGFVIHPISDLSDSVEIVDGLYISSSMDTLRLLMGGSLQQFKLCLGYAGWGPGQLEKELQEGAWVTSSATKKHSLETPPKQIWEQVLRDMGIDPAMLLHGGGLH